MVLVSIFRHNMQIILTFPCINQKALKSYDNIFYKKIDIKLRNKENISLRNPYQVSGQLLNIHFQELRQNFRTKFEIF